MFKSDRSHSEVGDTLRYFNSFATSKSWCGQEYFCQDDLCYLKGGPCPGNLVANRHTNKGGKSGKKSRSNSSVPQQVVSSNPALAMMAIRNNSVAGYHFDTM